MYFDAPKMQNAILYINGDEKGNYFEDYNWSVREGGYYTPGERIAQETGQPFGRIKSV